MSPAIPGRSILAYPSSRRIEQARQRSTLQEINAQDGVREAAILHGQAKNHSRNAQKQPVVRTQTSDLLDPRHTPSNMAFGSSRKQPSSASSHHQESRNMSNPHSNRKLGSSRHHKSDRDQRQGSMRGNNKRKAEASLDQRPARRSRLDQPRLALKDEAYIRRTMQIPTSQDYPKAPGGIFKSPKQFFLNASQGLAEMREDFNELAKDVWKCTVTYDSASRKEMVEGEGRSKVRILGYPIEFC